jgi:hypothetical protein
VVNSASREIMYTPPACGQVPAMMAELVEWLNAEKEIHPVLVSGIAQYQLVHIHPFLDTERYKAFVNETCLRFFTDDVPEQAAAAEKLFRQAASGEVALITNSLVMAEIVWVLGSYYHLPRPGVRGAACPSRMKRGVGFHPAARDELREAVLRRPAPASAGPPGANRPLGRPGRPGRHPS